MKPRTQGGVRVREPRIEPHPPPHEREDERLLQPVELPDGDDESDDGEPTEEQPTDPVPEEAQPPRATGRPASSTQSSSSQRRQVRWRDIEHPIAPPDDADQRDEDWSGMNWKKSVKELCDPDVTALKRRLRRIHLRWYHATAAAMKRLLDMIGCPESTIQLIDDVVATCRVCRMWTRRAPDTKLAIRISVKFNQVVQVDLLF